MCCDRSRKRSKSKYIAVADSLGLPIKGIIETHLHADFVSGHIELQEMTGATIYITEKAKAEFEHYVLLKMKKNFKSIRYFLK